MSHFSVLVVGDPSYNLAPFHEFECTGDDNEFIQDIDITAACREEYEADTSTRLKAPDGSLHNPYDERFYRNPTEEEKKEIGILAGSGGNGRISWYSKDWSDGSGYSPRIKFIPNGWEETEVPTKDTQSFVEWLDDYHGKKAATYATLDLGDAHKYGYTLVDESGEVLKVIDRTNPHKKWDYWTTGGRYSDRILRKDGRRVDKCRKDQIDFKGMRRDAGTEASHEWLTVHAVIDNHPPIVSWLDMRAKHADNIEAARKEYGEQAGVVAFKEAFGFNYGLEGVDPFLIPHELYVQQAVDLAFTCFAFVKDRQWQERGKMGWFACVSDEKDADAWNKTVAAFVDSLPNDTELTFVDCHI